MVWPAKHPTPIAPATVSTIRVTIPPILTAGLSELATSSRSQSPARPGKLAAESEPPMFKFTIRELLLVTLVAGVAVGWWVDRQRLAAYSAERDRLWRYFAVDSLSSISLRTGVTETIYTPDFEVLGCSPDGPNKSRSFRVPLPREQ